MNASAPPLPRLVPGADAPVPFVAPDAPIDLTNCDREPIHLPGAVQPYGALLALHAETLDGGNTGGFLAAGGVESLEK